MGDARAMRLTSPFAVLALVLVACPGGGKGDDSSTSSTPGTSGDPSTDPSTSTPDPTTGPSPGTSTDTGTTSEPGTSTTTATSEPGTTSTGPDTTGTGTDDTGVAPGPCVSDDDCKLKSDCCECAAVPADDDPPSCDLECDQPLCDQLGIQQAVCRFGVCITERLACDPVKVACDSLPPDCPEGQVATVEGVCWSGQCAPGEFCDVVPDCGLCAEGWMCVSFEAQQPVNPHCEPVPAACDVVDCDCAGTFVCDDPFNLCAQARPNDELVCSCPVC
jgi:hypothetical protein